MFDMAPRRILRSLLIDSEGTDANNVRTERLYRLRHYEKRQGVDFVVRARTKLDYRESSRATLPRSEPNWTIANSIAVLGSCQSVACDDFMHATNRLPGASRYPSNAPFHTIASSCDFFNFCSAGIVLLQRDPGLQLQVRSSENRPATIGPEFPVRKFTTDTLPERQRLPVWR